MSCSLSVLTVFNWANAAEYDQNDSTKSFRQTQEIQNYSQPLKLIHSLSWSADLQNNSQFSSTNESDDCDQFFKEDLSINTRFDRSGNIVLQKDDFLFVCRPTENEEVYAVDCYAEEEAFDESFYKTVDQVMDCLSGYVKNSNQNIVDRQDLEVQEDHKDLKESLVFQDLQEE